MTKLKQCTTCPEKKPLDQFYKSTQTTSGKRSSCKSCCSKYRIKHSKTAAYKEYKKKYRNSDKGKKARKSLYIKNKEIEFEGSEMIIIRNSFKELDLEFNFNFDNQDIKYLQSQLIF